MNTLRARRVVKKHRVPDFLGCGETAINKLRDLGLLYFFSMAPGGRAQCCYEDAIIALQQQAEAAGSLEALIAQAQEKAAERAERDHAERETLQETAA